MFFYSLSTATFGTDAYFNEIRNAICDYMENNDIEDLYDLNKEKYINDMRKNGAFGGTTEVQVYSIISKLKIVCFVRTLQKLIIIMPMIVIQFIVLYQVKNMTQKFLLCLV